MDGFMLRHAVTKTGRAEHIDEKRDLLFVALVLFPVCGCLVVGVVDMLVSGVAGLKKLGDVAAGLTYLGLSVLLRGLVGLVV
jgi:nitrate reductase NapE component